MRSPRTSETYAVAVLVGSVENAETCHAAHARVTLALSIAQTIST